MSGYDFDLIDEIREVTTVPMTILGGVGSIEDIGNALKRYGIIGAAAGSFFVFKGRFRAVLINYPTEDEKQNLIDKYFKTD